MSMLQAPGPAGQTIDAVRERAGEITDLISLPDILLALLILALTHYLIRALSSLAHVLARRFTSHRLLLLQLVPMMRISLWLASFYLILVGIISPSRESLIAFAATAGIGIGFAAQDVLKNILGGILIVMDRPFQVGDLVDVGEHHGEVIGIGLRATRLRTRDDSVVAVPNSEVVSQAVGNANTGALDCMVVTELFLPALVDTARVRDICYEAAATSPYLYVRKPIVIRFEDEFRETFLTRVRVKAYVYDHQHEKAFASDVAERAKRALLEARLLPESMVLGLDLREQARFLAAAPQAPAP